MDIPLRKPIWGSNHKVVFVSVSVKISVPEKDTLSDFSAEEPTDAPVYASVEKKRDIKVAAKELKENNSNGNIILAFNFEFTT